MDYLEGLRNIILNELNIGGQEVKEEKQTFEEKLFAQMREKYNLK